MLPCISLHVYVIQGWVVSLSSQRVYGESPDPEGEDGLKDHQDIHDDVMVMEYLQTSIVISIVYVKEQDRVLQRAKKFRHEGKHVLVYERMAVCMLSHLSQKA